MNIVTQVNEWRQIRSQLIGSIGFVPTMGNIHAGHVSLCARAKAENTLAVASIFINPAQFNQAQDLANYPRTLAEDYAQLAACGVDYVFVPTVEEMYADEYQVRVHEHVLSQQLEGYYRPGHFEGMLTIVLKLLNIIQAQKIYFGEKDFQQQLLVRKMVAALFLPVEVIACSTVRAHDGLALSSRNTRLNPEQRQQAAVFAQLLQSSLSVNEITRQLETLGFKIDYLVEQWQRRLAAVWLGDVRLIDNVPVE